MSFPCDKAVRNIHPSRDSTFTQEVPYMDLIEHEMASQKRYEDLKTHLEGSKMTETSNFFANPMSGAAGGAAGAAGLGGLIGAALGSNGGLFGGNNRNVNDFVTPGQLQTAVGSVIDNQQNTAVLEGLGDIKAAVPLAESQVQLALAGAQAELANQITANTMATLAGQADINKNVSDAIASSLASQNNLNVNILQSAAATREAVATYGQANLLATNTASSANLAAIAASTTQILNAFKDQSIDTLNRQLTVAELRNAEDRAEFRARATEVNVTQTVNQNQAQLQAQAQQQQQAILLNGVLQQLAGMQNAIATNSNLIVGNTGAVATGTQTANPVNVRA